MRLYLMPDYYDNSNSLTLTGDQHHYLVRVLRYRKGDEFKGRDKKGNGYLLKIIDIFEDRSVLEVKEIETVESGLPEIVLYQCVCKGKKMDQIIRQATESGVSKIIPVISDHSVARPDFDNTGKRERWNKIIKEAIQQSGSMANTSIGESVSIDDLPFMDDKSQIGLFFHQDSVDLKVSIHEYLSDYSLKQIFLIIGPEGGLSDREVGVLENNKYNPVYLKTNILRSETAAIYAIGAVQTILLESESWVLKV